MRSAIIIKFVAAHVETAVETEGQCLIGSDSAGVAAIASETDVTTRSATIG